MADDVVPLGPIPITWSYHTASTKGAYTELGVTRLKSKPDSPNKITLFPEDRYSFQYHLPTPSSRTQQK